MARRASFALSTVATLVIAAFVATAGACSSLPDLHFDDGTEGGAAEGGPLAEGGGTDGGSDGPVVGPCATTAGPEICDDGLDNDCNGHTDCDDPACGAFACVATPPDGWALVALALTAPPACPSGFASADVRVLAGSDTTGCPCTCAGSGGTGCTTGTTGVATGSDATCGTATAMVTSNTGATCTALPMDLPIGSVGSAGFGKLTPPAGPASCVPTASISKTDPTDGRTCTPSKVGSGCTGAMQCAPKAAGFTTCIEKAGVQVCPTGFANRRLAGTTSADTRTCTACSCNTTPCSGAVTLWSNSMCNAKTSKLTTAANTACAAPGAGSDQNYTAKFYTSNIAGGCAVGTAPTAQGALTFTDERTICCK